MVGNIMSHFAFSVLGMALLVIGLVVTITKRRQVAQKKEREARDEIARAQLARMSMLKPFEEAFSNSFNTLLNMPQAGKNDTWVSLVEEAKQIMQEEQKRMIEGANYTGTRTDESYIDEIKRFTGKTDKFLSEVNFNE